MYFRTWRMNLRLIASVISVLMAIGGAVGALASYSDVLPATRGFAKYVAKSETDSALTIATAPGTASMTVRPMVIVGSSPHQVDAPGMPNVR